MTVLCSVPCVTQGLPPMAEPRIDHTGQIAFAGYSPVIVTAWTDAPRGRPSTPADGLGGAHWTRR
jgi:hypothetical protein